ncbi:MAG: sulfite exporter TauE/SafE family protein [Flavobacteriales bacterium]|nr:sulfite exporter TauE/SafE family protein [Flavobacteriales bacterium]
MTIQTIIILVFIGLFAGILSGFVGVGGGIIIVPALVFFLGLTQHQAQGTSLFVLSMPVVLFAVINYWKTDNVNWKFGLIVASTFVVGAYIGSKLSLKLSPGMVKLVFGILLAYVSVRLIMSGYTAVNSNEA